MGFSILIVIWTVVIAVVEYIMLVIDANAKTLELLLVFEASCIFSISYYLILLHI
jgi:hypothetical protein